MKKINKDDYLITNTSAFAIIAVLLERGKLAKKHLDLLGITTSSASNRLSPLRILESFGMIERERSPNEKDRFLLVRVTQEGIDAYKKAKEAGITKYYIPNFSCFKDAV